MDDGDGGRTNHKPYITILKLTLGCSPDPSTTKNEFKDEPASFTKTKD